MNPNSNSIANAICIELICIARGFGVIGFGGLGGIPSQMPKDRKLKSPGNAGCRAGTFSWKEQSLET